MVVLLEDLALRVVEALRISLQRVVDRLRHVEELVLAVNDAPLRLEPDVLHERDERVEDLGHAAAEGRRGEMQDALAGQGLGKHADLVGERATRDRDVVGDCLGADVYPLKLHGGGGYRRPPPSLNPSTS